MKRVISLFWALVLCISLCACGKSEEAKTVQKAISEIGEVTYASGSAIEEAEKLYNELTDAEQKTVNNYDVLVQSQEKYNEIVLAPAAEMQERIDQMTDAFLAMDIASCREALTSIRGLKSEWETLDSEYVEVILAAMSDEDQTYTLDYLEFESYDAVLDDMCIHDTCLAQPGCVVSTELEGFWLVNDHGTFAAYNVWVKKSGDLKTAFNEYKEYVKQYTEITDSGDSFSFLNDNGETCYVLDVSTSNAALFQVRVPRF